MKAASALTKVGDRMDQLAWDTDRDWFWLRLKLTEIVIDICLCLLPSCSE